MSVNQAHGGFCNCFDVVKVLSEFIHHVVKAGADLYIKTLFLNNFNNLCFKKAFFAKGERPITS